MLMKLTPKINYEVSNIFAGVHSDLTGVFLMDEKELNW